MFANSTAWWETMVLRTRIRCVTGLGKKQNADLKFRGYEWATKWKNRGLRTSRERQQKRGQHLHEFALLAFLQLHPSSLFDLRSRQWPLTLSHEVPGVSKAGLEAMSDSLSDSLCTTCCKIVLLTFRAVWMKRAARTCSDVLLNRWLFVRPMHCALQVCICRTKQRLTKRYIYGLPNNKLFDIC